MSTEAAVRERPILFSGPMVRAILDGRKTQTRRVVKMGDYAREQSTWFLKAADGSGDFKFGHYVARGVGLALTDWIPCPYGQPGDRLWVRESWALVPRTAYAQSTGVQQSLCPADNHDAAVYREGWVRSPPGRWRPSIHMPRWASRLTLEITDVRVERLHSITEADARAEGFEPGEPITEMEIELMRGTKEGELAKILGVGTRMSAKFAFDCTWDDLNRKRGYGVTANPWVWVLSFRRL